MSEIVHRLIMPTALHFFFCLVSVLNTVLQIAVVGVLCSDQTLLGILCLHIKHSFHCSVSCVHYYFTKSNTVGLNLII